MDSRREVFAGEIDLGVVTKWVVSENMNLSEIILQSVKNERKKGLWVEL